MSKAKNRYFIVSGGGLDNTGHVGVWAYGTVKNDGRFPSLKDCLIEAENTVYDMTELSILSITELSETDYKQFYGEE